MQVYRSQEDTWIILCCLLLTNADITFRKRMIVLSLSNLGSLKVIWEGSENNHSFRRTVSLKFGEEFPVLFQWFFWVSYIPCQVSHFQ